LDQEICGRFTEWLESEGFLPTFDVSIIGGDTLGLVVQELIDRADHVFALGTANFFASQWCQNEIEFVRHKGKSYFPIVVDALPPSGVPRWFTGSAFGYDEVKYSIASSADGWSTLRPIARRIRQRRPLELRAIVAASIALAIGLPCAVLLLVQPLLGYAGNDVRRYQNLVEEINRRVINATNGADVGLRLRSSGGNDGTWVERNTGSMVASDMTEGTSVRVRRYFENGRELAIDRITVNTAPDGSTSLWKSRQIFPPNGSMIEEIYDSSGSLIGKRVRRRPDAPWLEYADRSPSEFPSAYRILVPILPGPVLPGYR
jgi:hypothetical protein